MPATYDSIATTTLTSGQLTITLSSISSAYTDLVLIVSSGSGAVTAKSFLLRFNGDSGSNYSDTNVRAVNTTAGSGRNSSQTYINLQGPTDLSIPSLFIVNIFSYSGSSINKTVLAQSSLENTSGSAVYNTVGLWRSTAAINSITLASDGTNYPTGTRVSLYGILKA